MLAIGLASIGLSATAHAQDAPATSLSVADLVAPVALYPDQLLAQVLTVSTTPQEVLDLGAWLIENDSLPGSKAEAAKTAGFSASAQYLAMFPQVVDNMGQQLEWTTQLGNAYTDDPSAVMTAIQGKRAEAEKVGNLKTSEQMTVTDKKADDGSTYIEITPTDPKVIYVPAYNPVTVYVTPPPATTTTVVQQQPTASGGAVAGIGLLTFGIGMAVGSSINNSYYPYPSWGYGGMYYGGRPYYPPPYRPPYYPGYRPAYGYNPPPNYHWNQVNRETNITVNNGGYYNKVNRNGNNRPANSNRPGQVSNNNRPGGGNDRPGANNRPGGSVANTNSRPGGASGGDRGYGAAGGGGGGRPAAAPSRPSPSSAASRPSPAASRPAPQPKGGGAFGGAGGASSGNSARAASSRGRQSAGASRGGGGGGGGGGRKR